MIHLFQEMKIFGLDRQEEMDMDYGFGITLTKTTTRSSEDTRQPMHFIKVVLDVIKLVEK